jgi:hypothetical protein
LFLQNKLDIGWSFSSNGIGALEPKAYSLRSCWGGYRCKDPDRHVRKGHDPEQWGFLCNAVTLVAGAPTGPIVER